MSASTLTNSLLLELDKTDNIFNRWSKQQQEWFLANSKNYDQCLNECDTTINALKEHSTALDSKRIEYDNICTQHGLELEKAKHYGDVLLQNKQTLEQQLSYFDQEEEKAVAALEDATVQYNLEMSKMAKTMKDLQHGMQNFSLLGLHFEKAEGDCMKFVFTQIDPSEPQREFYFLMLVDERNMYRLSGEPQPKLPLHCQALCGHYLDNLNSDNNIGLFVFLMRRMFCDLFSPKTLN